VKTKPGKVSVSSKAKPVVAKSKPASKTAAKPAVKAKAVVKAKPAAKPAAGKAAVKTSKPGVSKKPAPKPAPKAKPVAKPAAKAPAKPVSKAVAKSKPSTKPVAKPKAKVAAKPAKPAKPAVKAGKVAAKPAKPAKTLPKVQSPSKAAPVAVVAATPHLSASARLAAPIARAGRPSSRLAQLTVPSMAQTVASTAAKASYLQTMTPTLIAPPLPSTIKKDAKLANNWKSKPAEALSDAELMAMPDSEYMNEKQMAAFRFKLVQLKQDILSNAGETTEHLREDTVVVPDPADRATIEEEHALELRTRDRERKLLKKIEQSIGRIDAGDYGYCDETGEPIGVGRLLARPTATLSLEAQQRRELKQKMFGD
jgi:DnaK suppressor protein